MDKFGIVEAVQGQCALNDWHFVLSFSDFETNISSNIDNADGKSIFVFDFMARPVRELGQTLTIAYDCIIWLGRKFDPGSDTSAELAETHQQKYDRRIKSLMTDLDVMLSNLQCANNLTASGEKYEFELNAMDINADFVATPVTLTQNV